MHSFCIRISPQPFLSQFSSNPALLHSSERDPKVRIIATIDPNHTRLDPPRYSMRLGQILRENGAAKPVCGIIRTVDCLFFRFEA